MKHTIIAWDCAFRSHYHLIDALLAQDFPRSQWELIFVEQRTKRYAGAYHQALGLPTLAERCMKKRNVKAIYLDDAYTEPLHVGRLVNAGLEAAKGDIVSVMDGDQLVPSDFLRALSRYYDEHRMGIACVARHMATRPARRAHDHTFESDFNWMEASFNLEDVLAVCPGKHAPYPATTQPGSFAPLLSARRSYWDAVLGCDTHPVWATGASSVLGDAARRLEMATGTRAEQLLDTYAVHPWHPVGFARQKRAESDEQVLAYLGLQREITDSTRMPSWQARERQVMALYQANRALVEAVHQADTDALRRLYLEAKKAN
jgi:hypothetical protein